MTVQNPAWLPPGAKKDSQTINHRWEPTQQRLIDGVSIREIKNVPKRSGWLTEIFRREWVKDLSEVDQIFQVTLFPGGISAWHAHDNTTDRLFAVQGLIKVVLFDSRPGSQTRGAINEFFIGERRPTLIIIPPRIFHGVQNAGADNAVLLNMVDRSYNYEDPDHWRLPEDSEHIPYKFQSGSISSSNRNPG